MLHSAEETDSEWEAKKFKIKEFSISENCQTHIWGDRSLQLNCHNQTDTNPSAVQALHSRELISAPNGWRKPNFPGSNFTNKFVSEIETVSLQPIEFYSLLAR